MTLSLSTQACIQESGIAFGTSGARGLVEQFSDNLCAAFCVNFIQAMQAFGPFDRVALAIDLRPSSPKMAAACAGAIQALGYTVDYCGVLPTPALAWYSLRERIPAIMITGSHIPFDRNGIKFYRPDGEISKADEHTLLTTSFPLPAFTPALPEISTVAKQAYIQRYLDNFPTRFLQGWCIGVYEHSAAGRDITIEILQHLGAQVQSLGRSDAFVPIDTEAVSDEDIQRGLEWSKTGGFDAIVSTDGDGDRPLVADERGHWLRGDLLGLICARTLGYQAIALPVSCNSAIELCGEFTQVVRTRIGSPYVIEAMQDLAREHRKVAGFEANGGFLTDELPTRDAILPMLALFQAARAQSVAISALLQALPSRFTASDRLTAIPTAQSKALLQRWQTSPTAMRQDLSLSADIVNTDNTDGLRVTLSNHEIIHFRPSGNAPELRCYVETDDLTRSLNLLKSLLLACQQCIN